ncbi:RHS repeat-associated core domain-containing protein [Gaoshiqia sp. Z1-71]|uniref:RHS repeat-associated core domain-containing protein n=1 Tax=Gaoshiqia hydrogeniformans TaxID=3290090 RepID=UPI003BF842D4
MVSFKFLAILHNLYRKYFNGTTEYEQYDYDTNSGYLYQIRFTAGGTTATVWQLTTMDEYGHIRQATIGSASASWNYDSNNMLSQIAASGVQQYNYSFDVNTGNLNSRTNFLKNKTESFGYDSNQLDRLASVTGPEDLDISYTPDNNGNIYSKSDAGDYTLYDGYAVSEISGAQNIPETDQEIEYYSFEKVKKITEGDKTADFEYNADRQRIRMTLKTSGVTTKTRWYFGSSCEREDVGGTITQYIWIGGDAYTAVAVAKKVGTGSWTVYNIFRDHLGTMTHLKNAGTGVVDEYSFDAWGRRRDKDDWTYTLTGEPALFAGRGFTAHEYLADFNLYNMNGRMYDPVVGRFLSPDPVVQAPGFTQSFNRYSYCLNNPLIYTDPSGYKWRWGNPFYHFQKFMQWVNDNTTKLREKMADAGIPDFGVGVSINGGTAVPFVSVPVSPGTDVSVGYNTSTGKVGIGNNSSGFHQFYYPSANHDPSVNNALRNIEEARQVYGETDREVFLANAGYYSGEIKPYNPSFFDRWSETNNPLGRMSYDLIDGISVTAQSFVLGPKAMHLNGSEVIGNERVDAFVNTAEWGLAVGGMYSQYARTGGKSLVDITLSEPRFRLQIHVHGRSALKGSGAAGSIKAWHLNLNNTHLYFNPRYWKYYYPWWRW